MCLSSVCPLLLDSCTWRSTDATSTHLSPLVHVLTVPLGMPCLSHTTDISCVNHVNRLESDCPIVISGSYGHARFSPFSPLSSEFAFEGLVAAMFQHIFMWSRLCFGCIMVFLCVNHTSKCPLFHACLTVHQRQNIASGRSSCGLRINTCTFSC